MKYSDLKQIFRDLKKTSPRENLTAYIIFTENSFKKPYSLLSRTYHISSDNKAFLSAPVIKCKKTPKKKCNFVAERREKR